MQAAHRPGDFLMKPRVPDFIVGEQLRLDDCPITLLNKGLATRLVNFFYPIQVPLPLLMYPPSAGRAHHAKWTLRDDMRQDLAGLGAQ
jgi:hypothetical protein